MIERNQENILNWHSSRITNGVMELGKFSIQGESVVREFNIVYLKYADIREKIQRFFYEAR